MTTIRLLDARRGLNLKCRELFQDEKIAEEIYRFLCDGIEECEDAGPERKNGRWIEQEDYNLDTYYDCSVCGESWCTVDGTPWENGMNYCPHCGASMTEGEE